MSGLPPFLALLDYLVETNLYDITVISAEEDDISDAKYIPLGVKIIHYYRQEPRTDIFARIRNRIRRDYLFKIKATNDAAKIKYDILWVLSENTALLLKRFLRGKKYIITMYELRDRYPDLLKKIKPILKQAVVNVACEYNRANMMRIWLQLDETPIVLPNKPYLHPRKRNINCVYDEQLSEKKRIILYQGHISRDRNLEGICAAVNDMNEYTLILMGDGGEYIEYLRTKYKNVLFLNYVKAPMHLNVTSHAHIGIVTYDYYSLNTIYCAPNKIWEYSGFGIPVLANDIPGLRYTVGSSKSGICLDMNSPESIKKAIKVIEENYDVFSKNAIEMYNSCNISEIIDKIMLQYNIKKDR